MTSASLVRAGYALSSWALILSAALFLFFSLIQPSAFSGVRNALLDRAAPLLSILYQPVAGATEFVRDVSGLAQLQEDISALRIENQSLRARYAALLPLRGENEMLRAAASYVEDERLKPVMSAPVLWDARGIYSKSFLIEAGSLQGVEVDMAASYNGMLVGRVVEVGKNYARILMATDINARIPVSVDFGTDGIRPAVMRGQNDDIPMLHYLDKVDVKAHDGLVVTSGMGGIYPRGLPVGKVSVVAGATPRYEVVPFVAQGDFTIVSLHRFADSVIHPNE